MPSPSNSALREASFQVATAALQAGKQSLVLSADEAAVLRQVASAPTPATSAPPAPVRGSRASSSGDQSPRSSKSGRWGGWGVDPASTAAESEDRTLPSDEDWVGKNVCRHWAKGYCNRGTGCHFAHVGPSPNKALCPNAGAPLVVNATGEDLPSLDELRRGDKFIVVKSSSPCKDYAAGSCHRGDKCKFAHIGGGSRKSPLACRDWQAGVCNRGSSCKFRHGEADTLSDPDSPSCSSDWQQQQPQQPQHHFGSCSTVSTGPSVVVVHAAPQPPPPQYRTVRYVIHSAPATMSPPPPQMHYVDEDACRHVHLQPVAPVSADAACGELERLRSHLQAVEDEACRLRQRFDSAHQEVAVLSQPSPPEPAAGSGEPVRQCAGPGYSVGHGA